MNFRRKSSQEEPEINLVPLIDVMLVIIIFLMLTTTFSKTSGLEVALPTAETDSTLEISNEIIVAITATNEVVIGGQPVADKSISAIAAALTSATRPGEREPVVVINADAKATHQSVIDVMQAAQQAGLAHITFATRQAN
jgi:biopolymer transport protein ExbD